MAEYRLTERPALGVEPITGDEVNAAEVSGLAIVSMAVPLGGDDALNEVIAAGYGVGLPAVGGSVRSDRDGARILGLQPGQFFIVFETDAPRPPDIVRAVTGDKAYLTDQSDSWAVVRVGGAKSRAALERICPVDLHPDAFKTGACARTLMEHLGVIILREADSEFLLMSARSSAPSFWHAIATSIGNLD